MDLIIAEKKGVAEAIAEALGGFQKSTGYFESESSILTWASGHLLELKEPQEIDEKFKTWKLQDLPIKIDETWERRPKFYNIGSGLSKEEKERLENSQKVIDRQLSLIEKFLKISDVKKIIHAGDPDSEGQLLIDELIEYFNCKKPVMRVLINDNNANKVREAFKKMEPNEKYLSLGKAAYARSLADMYLGINASRFFTLKANLNEGRISVGRVKTPVLGLIVNRYLEIKNHVKSCYYILEKNIVVVKKSNLQEKEEYVKAIERYEKEFLDDKRKKIALENLSDEFARLNERVGLKLNLAPPKEILSDGKVVDKALLEALAREISGIQRLIVSKEIVKKDPPLPFNLIELQQYCNKKWSYESDRVMKITQDLRDKYKAITYNRSDCQYLSLEHFKEAPEVIERVFKNLDIKVENMDYTKISKCFNDDLVTAHHAIIPTSVSLDLKKLTEEEKNVYQIICKYYIVQFLGAMVAEKTSGEVKVVDTLILKGTSTKILDYGYREFLDDRDSEGEKEETSSLSSLYSGEYECEIIDGKILEKETAPKKHYTEASLLKDMTSISKYVKDIRLKEALRDKDKGKKGESGGIGTPATRSTVIKDIFRDRYVELKGKDILPTELGLKIYEYIADKVKTANVTAEWWLIQREIEEGAEVSKLIRKVEKDFLDIMSKSYEKLEYGERVKEVIGICPKCQRDITESKKAYNCSCGFIFWKNDAISLKKFQDLIKGKTVSVKGLKSKAGKSYNAKIKLKDNYEGFEIVEFLKDR
ncbi:MAG: DNA topoisomerase [Cetobacterium sp.]|uniref:DNA topoisomerase n=1 Tax=Cetobacterium sp. TaxID=2071632 RepID=UPI003F2D4C17